MFAEEWPLLMFTLLMQLAVGSYIFFVIIRTVNRRENEPESIKATKLGMTLIGPIIIVAFILSVFHLGTPYGAYRSIGNLGSSWLSREILFSGIFFGLWFIGYLTELRGKWSEVLGWINSIVGIMVVIAMASIYSTSILPAWSNVNTYFSFIGTTILFGSVSSVIVVLTSKEVKTSRMISVLKVIGIIGAIAIIFQLVYLPFYKTAISASGAAGLKSATLLSSKYLYATIIRWVVSIVSLGLIFYCLFKRLQKVQMYPLFLVALSFILVGEFMGRYIFYAIGVPIFIG